VRSADTVSRLGGDEFTVLLENIENPAEAARVADDLIRELSEPFCLPNGNEVVVGATVGIAIYPEHGASEEALLQGADAALYQAKSEGRGRYRFFSDALTQAARERIELEARLRRGEPALKGWVEPIGTAHLLRAVGAAGFSGKLELRAREARRAEVELRRGEVCAGNVSAGSDPTVGPLALLDLLGLEWLEYELSPAASEWARVPLGQLEQLIETALQQNNTLLARLYQQGLEVENVELDRAAVEEVLHRLPAGTQEPARRLIAGQPAAALVEQGAATPGLLKSILHELRRKALVQVRSLQAVRPETSPPQAAVPRRSGGARHSWLVIAAAGLVTVACAVGGYGLYLKLRAGPRAPTPGSVAPSPASMPR
jgi:hypothetical protein